MRTEDGRIIQECLNGEPEAFGVLVDKYREGIYAFVYAKLRNFEDAQDVTQEVFLKAYKDLHSLKRWESFAYWLYRIAYARCAEFLRKNSKRIDKDFIEDQDTKIIDVLSLDYYRESQLNESVRDALDLLPEVYREALMLHYFGGMNSNEIADALGASPTAIRMRLSRARVQLKEEIIAMMGTAFEGQKLRVGFTFRVVEAIKQIRIQPVPPKILPWGLSLATGIIITFLSLGTHFNLTNTSDILGGYPLPGETKVLKSGEISVDTINVSNISVISNQQMNGDGLGSIAPSLQNALFMAPQAGDTWTRKADMPTGRGFPAASIVNGKIYVIGGFSRDGNLSNTEEYDPKEDKWTIKADMPTKRQYFSTGVVNGKIYAIGGIGDAYLSTVEEYDPQKDIWTKKTDMPTARNASCSTVNGKIYAIGGYGIGQPIEFPIVEEYDPIADRWAKKADMLAGRQFFTTCVANGKIYAIGGWRNGEIISSVEEYDPVTDKWTKKANMTTARIYHSSAEVNGKIYVIGGGAGEPRGSFASTVEEYDPSTDTWAKKDVMPIPRSQHSVAAVNNKIYIMGGQDGPSSFLLTVEEYDPGVMGQSINFKGKLPTTWGETKTASINKKGD